MDFDIIILHLLLKVLTIDNTINNFDAFICLN